MRSAPEGLEFLLDLLARLELRATFYTTANFALHRTDLVRRIVAGGHEVASHDYYHGLTAGSDPAGSRRTLEELTGQRIVGYRAPRLAAASSAALAAAGYRYNSSINPTWIPTRYNNLRAPCSVSREEGLTIYPVSVSAPFRVPLFWISLHVMPLPLYKLAVPQRPAPRRAPEPLFPSVGVFRTAARAGFRCSGLSYALFGDGPATEIHPAAGVAESPRLSVFDHPRIPRMR